MTDRCLDMLSIGPRPYVVRTDILRRVGLLGRAKNCEKVQRRSLSTMLLWIDSTAVQMWSGKCLMCVKQHYYHVRWSKESICVFRSLPCQLPCKTAGGAAVRSAFCQWNIWENSFIHSFYEWLTKRHSLCLCSPALDAMRSHYVVVLSGIVIVRDAG
jgi:hypothetical protein